jgi:hypothetical protein
MTVEPARMDYASVFPAGVRAMVGPQRAVDAAAPLEPLLLELVKIAGLATAAPTASTCAPSTLAPSASPSSAYSCSPPGFHRIAPHRTLRPPASGMGSPERTANQEGEPCP